MVNDFMLSIMSFIKGLDLLSIYVGIVITTYSLGVLSNKTNNKSKLFILGASLLTPISILVLFLRPSWGDGGKDE
jgi:hypothetical protein